MPYAFTQQFLESGDPRLFLAMNQKDKGRMGLFDELIKYDDLIQIGANGRSLGYNHEATEAYEEHIRSAEMASPILGGASGPLGLSAQYKRGTCVIAGTGPSLNVEAVAKLQAHGVVVIALGNAAYALQQSGSTRHADIWVGAQDVLSYLTQGLEAHNTLAVVQVAYAESNLWDQKNRKVSGKTVADMVNVAHYSASSVPISEFFENPQITDLGCPSSFTTALTMAVAMGFQNIFLTGINLGGPLHNYYTFQEIPHQEVLERKTPVYDQIKARFPEWNKELLKRCIRVGSLGASVLNIPEYPIEYLSEHLGFVQGLSRSGSTAANAKLSMSAARNRRHDQVAARLKRAELSAPILSHQLDELMVEVPAVFNTEITMQASEKLKEALASGVECKDCTRRSIAGPVMEMFTAAVRAQVVDPALHPAWTKLFPDHFIVNVGGNLFFRADKAEDEQEYRTLTG